MEEDLPDYSQYGERLKTFNEKSWPSDSAVYVKDLAEAGFVYTGEIDLVFCFKCGITESNWKDEENPTARHAVTNSLCPHILKTRKLTDGCSVSLKSIEDFEREDLLYDWVKDKGIVQRKIVFERSTNEEEEEEENVEPPPAPVVKEDVVEEPTMNLRLANEEMRYELKRFESFALCAPSKHWPSPDKLAGAGFYFIDDRNGMKCFCCGTSIAGWESADQCPFTKHRAQSPTCEFVRGSLCGNMPVGEESIQLDRPLLQTLTQQPTSTLMETSPERQPSTSNSFDPSIGYCHPSPPPALAQDMSMKHFIRHPPAPMSNPPTRPFFVNQNNNNIVRPGLNQASKYSDELQRLRSFFTWPRDSVQTAMSLVKTGFFYTGKKDYVQCFACHLVVSDWTTTDNPSQVHHSRRPTCPFLAAPSNRLKDNNMRYFCEGRGEQQQTIAFNIPPQGSYQIQHMINERSNMPPPQLPHYYQQPIRAAGATTALPMMTGIQYRPQYHPRPQAQPVAPLTGGGGNGGNFSPLPACMENLHLSPPIPKPPSGYPQGADEIRRIHELNKERAREAYTRKQDANHERQEFDRFCKICEVNPVVVTFIPCGHLVVCESCAMGLMLCPICRSGISKTQRTFFFGN